MNAATDPIPPDQVINFPGTVRQVTFSPDGYTAYVVHDDYTIRLDWLVADYVPPAIIVLLTIPVLVALARLWRLRRKRRVPGEPYCRKCNYQLTSFQGDKCPECGADLTGRHRVIAQPIRRSVRRFFIIVALFAAAVFGVRYYAEPLTAWTDSWLEWHSPALFRRAQANSPAVTASKTSRISSAASRCTSSRVPRPSSVSTVSGRSRRRVASVAPA